MVTTIADWRTSLLTHNITFLDTTNTAGQFVTLSLEITPTGSPAVVQVLNGSRAAIGYPSLEAALAAAMDVGDAWVRRGWAPATIGALPPAVSQALSDYAAPLPAVTYPPPTPPTRVSVKTPPISLGPKTPPVVMVTAPPTQPVDPPRGSPPVSPSTHTPPGAPQGGSLLPGFTAPVALGLGLLVAALLFA